MMITSGNICIVSVQTLSWQVVTPDGNSSSRLTYNPDYFSYKFGLVRWGSDLISSGIVWTSCVSDLSVSKLDFSDHFDT